MSTYYGGKQLHSVVDFNEDYNSNGTKYTVPANTFGVLRLRRLSKSHSGTLSIRGFVIDEIDGTDPTVDYHVYAGDTFVVASVPLPIEYVYLDATLELYNVPS